MSKVTVKSRFAITSLIGPEFNAAFHKELGDAIVSEIQNDLDKGNSPVRGERRLEQYKDTKKYPGGRKPNRPVNLSLTGEMRRYIRSEVVSGRAAVRVGLLNAPQDVQARAIAHLKGTPHMAQRKFLPWEEGDQLTVRIQRRLISIYQERLARLIAKGNK
jgi:hypothetical protein